jgi:hypothetical protein
MSKTDTYTFNRPCGTPSRRRSILIALLFILCVPVFLYQLVPAFTRSTDAVIGKIVSHFHHGRPCTADIGDDFCCAIFMKASPCLDECRKQFIDRETFSPTIEYDQCSDKCLRDWAICR